MTLRDKAKELIQHTIDDKKLDEKLVLQQTKEELLKLSEDITYASEVLAELKKSGQIDEQKFQSLDTNLRSPEKRKEATQEIANIIDTISARYETMQAEEKEKVKTMTEAIKNSKQSLTGLKAEVLQAGNVDYEKIEKELVDDAAKKLEEHWYSKPFAAGYRKHIHKKVEELKNGKKDADEGRWKKVKSSINDWFYGLIGGMFIGKKIADLIGEKMSKYKDKIADGGKKATERVKDKATDVKDNVKMVAEKSPEALAQQEKTLERYIRNTVKKNFHKDLSDEQLKRVSAKLNLKQQLKDGTSEWSKFMEAAAHGGDMSDLNYMDATLQSMAMPIEIFANLVSVLDEEGIVDIKQAGLTITGNVVEYGLKWFKLFGAGLSTVVGKMDINELNGHIAHMYEKSPLAAKQLLFALVYRTADGPLMRMVTNAGAYLTKTLTWPLFESRGDLNFVKNAMQDTFRGNMNTALKQMKETNDLVQKLGVKDKFLAELTDELKIAVQRADECNNILVHANTLWDDANFMKNLQGKFAATSEEYKFIAANNGMSKSQFMNKLGVRRANETQVMGTTMKSFWGRWGTQFKNRGAKMLVGDNSTRHIIIDFAHNIEAQGKVARNMLANRNLFDQFSNKIYRNRIAALSEVMKGSEILDKAVWRFKDVNELADFTENMKLMARKAPATAKFILWKSPILIVWGLALSEWDTMSEKMQSVMHGLMGLVPLVGPAIIMRDGLWGGERTNLWQAALGGALVGVDFVRLIKGIAAKDASKVVHMFTQPVVDLIEISKFMTQSGINTVKMVRDGVKLVREGKAVGAFEKILASLKGVPKRRWAVAAAVAALAGYGISELVSDDKEINKEAEVLFAKYKNDPNGLDKALAENRSTFDQDTKNECLKYALIAKLGLSGDYAAQTEVRHEKGVYTISMPIVISKQYGGDILSSVESSLVQVEPNAQLQMEVRGQVAYAFRKEAEAQLKAEGESTEAIPRIIDEKLEAMGYNPELGKQKS